MGTKANKADGKLYPKMASANFINKFVIKFAFFIRIFYIVTLKQNSLECIKMLLHII